MHHALKILHSLKPLSHSLTMALFPPIPSIIIFFSIMLVVNSEPQTNLLNKGCAQYNIATQLSVFYSNLNSTFTNLRTQLSNSSNTNRFATAKSARASNPVYAMAQCRSYLSVPDCLSCFSVAVSQIRNCSTANGARVIYDGCFLRYESIGFFDQTTVLGNFGICGNNTSSQASDFSAAVGGLLADLLIATPRIGGFFATAKREVVSGSEVYGVAQCAVTVSETGCKDCLIVAHDNIDNCPPNDNGRAVDAGCFLRYSDTAFFNDNQTMDLTPFLRERGSSKKKAIIGGVLGGVGFLLAQVVLIVIFLFNRRKHKTDRKGDILGAT